MWVFFILFIKRLISRRQHVTVTGCGLTFSNRVMINIPMYIKTDDVFEWQFIDLRDQWLIIYSKEIFLHLYWLPFELKTDLFNFKWQILCHWNVCALEWISSVHRHPPRWRGGMWSPTTSAFWPRRRVWASKMWRSVFTLILFHIKLHLNDLVKFMVLHGQI